MTNNSKLNTEKLQAVYNSLSSISLVLESDDTLNDVISSLGIFAKSVDEGMAELRHVIETEKDRVLKEWEEDANAVATIEDGNIIYMETVIEDVNSSECLRFEVDPWLYYGLNSMQLIELGKLEDKENVFCSTIKNSSYFNSDVCLHGEYIYYENDLYHYNVRVEATGENGRWFWIISVSTEHPLDYISLHEELQKEKYQNEGYSEC